MLHSKVETDECKLDKHDLQFLSIANKENLSTFLTLLSDVITL